MRIVAWCCDDEPAYLGVTVIRAHRLLEVLAVFAEQEPNQAPRIRMMSRRSTGLRSVQYRLIREETAHGVGPQHQDRPTMRICVGGTGRYSVNAYQSQENLHEPLMCSSVSEHQRSEWCLNFIDFTGLSQSAHNNGNRQQCGTAEHDMGKTRAGIQPGRLSTRRSWPSMVWRSARPGWPLRGRGPEWGRDFLDIERVKFCLPHSQGRLRFRAAPACMHDSGAEFSVRLPPVTWVPAGFGPLQDPVLWWIAVPWTDPATYIWRKAVRPMVELGIRRRAHRIPIWGFDRGGDSGAPRRFSVVRSDKLHAYMVIPWSGNVMWTADSVRRSRAD